MEKIALLVIDAQQEYFAPIGKLVLPDGPLAVERIADLLTRNGEGRRRRRRRPPDEWLPGQDSNLQPRGYKGPRVSTGLGLSHPRRRPAGTRRGRALPPALAGGTPGYDLAV
jgi:hypothetical protein